MQVMKSFINQVNYLGIVTMMTTINMKNNFIKLFKIVIQPVKMQP